MKVIEVIQQDKLTLSFEFFPPKTPEQELQLFGALEKLKEFKPDFVSVTYGAMGTTREKTFSLVSAIKSRFALEPVAHLTCVAATREDVKEQLKDLAQRGIENILALRGDPPLGEENLAYPAGGFRYARDLIAFIKKEAPGFCLGAAGHPEGHREAPSLEKGIEYLKQKVEAGAEYIITQLFFDNGYFFNFAEKCQEAGINVPIIPGIMVITNFKQIKKFTETCGATIPPKIMAKLEVFKDDPASLIEFGVDLALHQCEGLLKAKVPGLHFFVLNRAEPVSLVISRLR